MKYFQKTIVLIAILLVIVSIKCEKDDDVTNPTITVNGSLEKTNGITVVRLWGSRQEMGYAYGYLLADKLTDVINELLFDYLLKNYSYEEVVNKMKDYIIWPSGYEEEMSAVIAGMKDKLGKLPVVTHKSIQSGSKEINADMIALLNSSRDLVDVSPGCSAFAVWGNGTDDNQTRAGGNSDRAEDGDILSKYTILVVRKPDYGLATVNAFFVGALGFSRGMNEKGVVCCPTGVDTGPKSSGECNPIIYIRDLMEQIEAGPNMVQNIVQFFEARPRCGANSIVFAQGKPSWTNVSNNQMAVVIECDCNGVTARLPSYNSQINTPFETAIITANEYLQREGCTHTENSTMRYTNMAEVLSTNKINGLADMQKVLQASQQACTIISVYLEPDAKKIHVAFHKQGDPPSPSMTPASFTWDELLIGIPN